jgi:hypothetical protein
MNAALFDDWAGVTGSFISQFSTTTTRPGAAQNKRGYRSGVKRPTTGPLGPTGERLLFQPDEEEIKHFLAQILASG